MSNITQSSSCSLFSAQRLNWRCFPSDQPKLSPSCQEQKYVSSGNTSFCPFCVTLTLTVNLTTLNSILHVTRTSKTLTLCQGSKCFTSTELFNPYNNSMRQVLLLQPFHRWGHWRKWCVPVTQEIYYSDGTPIQVIGPWSLWSEPLCDAVSHVTGTIGRWKSRKLKWREDRLSTHWAGDNT